MRTIFHFSEAASGSLPRLTRQVIVLVSLLQGLMVYGWLSSWWGSRPGFTYLGVTTCMAVPAFFVLCVDQLRDRLLWWCMGGITAVVLGLNASVWWIANLPESVPLGLWCSWLLCLFLLLLVALSWVQVLLQHRSLRAVPYGSFFAHAWNNAMVLPFAALFVALCWGVLALWASVFSLIGVDFFAHLFQRTAFVCMSTGLMVGLGVLTAREQPKALRMMLQLVLGMFKLLLPLIALVVVLFVLFLPFTGVHTLWNTGYATLLLCSLLLQLLVAVNAVYQDGSHSQPPYPQPLQWLVRAAVYCMPVLALLAVWGMGLRVQQYGWSVARVWGATVVGVLLLYSLGYAWGGWRQRGGWWLRSVALTNPAMSCLVMALLVAWHTPWLSPYRTSAYHQAQRLQDGRAVVEPEALESLRFDYGRYGLQALQSLKAHPSMAQPAVQAQLAQLAQATERSVARSQAHEQAAQKAVQQLHMAPGHDRPAPDWWQALEQSDLRAWVSDCQGTPMRCVVLQLPLQQGSQKAGAEHNPLICLLGGSVPRCEVFVRNAALRWKYAGTLSWGGSSASVRAQIEAALAQGNLQPETPQWSDVKVPGLQAPAVRLQP